MIEQLFGSKTRVKLLHLFYSNPNRSFYVREITRKIDEQINSVRRELSNLLKIGIIKSDSEGNKLYYEVNQKYGYYEALRDIFSEMKSRKVSKEVSSSGDELADRFNELGSVSLVLLTGVFVRTQAPVDIVVVGDVNRNKTRKLIEELEKEEDKELRYTVLNPEEYEYRLELNDRFLLEVMGSKKTVIIDEKAGKKEFASNKSQSKKAEDKTKSK